MSKCRECGDEINWKKEDYKPHPVEIKTDIISKVPIGTYLTENGDRIRKTKTDIWEPFVNPDVKVNRSHFDLCGSFKKMSVGKRNIKQLAEEQRKKQYGI